MNETTLTLDFGLSLHISLVRSGADMAVTVSGGQKPHIGSVAVAVPRESLSGSGEISATASVINITAHKDDALSVPIAVRLASRFNCVVSVSVGVHLDGITGEQIRQVLGSVDLIVSAAQELAGH